MRFKLLVVVVVLYQCYLPHYLILDYDKMKTCFNKNEQTQLDDVEWY